MLFHSSFVGKLKTIKNVYYRTLLWKTKIQRKRNTAHTQIPTVYLGVRVCMCVSLCTHIKMRSKSSYSLEHVFFTDIMPWTFVITF